MTSNPITFSTLACAEWTADTCVARAAEFGYDGLEWRGGRDGHVSPAMPPAERQRLRRLTAEAGLTALAVTAYSSFTSADPAERAAQVDELRRHVDLAADLGAKYVRTFVGRVPAGRTVADVEPGIVDCLRLGAEHAAQAGVVVGAETHDDFVHSASIARLLRLASHPALAAVWDVGNAFAAGEDPSEGLGQLGHQLAYVQIKDGVHRDGQWRLTRLGEGEVPLAHTLQELVGLGYGGGLSVEWERAWHPELDPPEVALPAALRAARRWLADAHQPQAGHEGGTKATP
jgi:sugar phosphate isomerase/epimerase